jgi:hypothetical protein
MAYLFFIFLNTVNTMTISTIITTTITVQPQKKDNSSNIVT